MVFSQSVLPGNILAFKTISKQEYETRSDFRAVSGDLSLIEASQLLASPIVPVPGPESRRTIMKPGPSTCSKSSDLSRGIPGIPHRTN